MDDTLYGGIEAGGTKFVCVVSDARGHVQDDIQIPTLSPNETMRQVIDFFRKYPQLEAIGLGSFGPIDLNMESETYGSIRNTPKLEWVDYDIASQLKTLGVKVFVDTDVNCAAVGEQHFGVGKGLDSFLYLTVGTGIGGSYVNQNQILKGMAHSEIGHMYVPKVSGDENFEGVCAYHHSCLEGLASGPALQKRWGMEPTLLGNEHQAWDMEAHYLGLAICNLIMILMPERIIIGGGVMNHKGLVSAIQEYVVQLLGDYIAVDVMNDYIVLPQLGELSAAIGAIHGATQATI